MSDYEWNTQNKDYKRYCRRCQQCSWTVCILVLAALITLFGADILYAAQYFLAIRKEGSAVVNVISPDPTWFHEVKILTSIIGIPIATAYQFGQQPTDRDFIITKSKYTENDSFVLLANQIFLETLNPRIQQSSDGNFMYNVIGIDWSLRNDMVACFILSIIFLIALPIIICIVSIIMIWIYCVGCCQTAYRCKCSQAMCCKKCSRCLCHPRRPPNQSSSSQFVNASRFYKIY